MKTYSNPKFQEYDQDEAFVKNLITTGSAVRKEIATALICVGILLAMIVLVFSIIYFLPSDFQI